MTQQPIPQATDDEPDAVDGWPEPKDLVKALDQLDADGRLERIHSLTAWLGGQDELQRQRYRRAIVEAGFIRPGDWNSMVSEGKRSHAEKLRANPKPTAEPDECPYQVRNGCVFVNSPFGGDVLLSKFVPEVVAEVTKDDGAEVTKLVRIRVTLPSGRASEVEVPAEQLHKAREWSARAVGAAAVITPMSRDEAHVATAAQYLGNYRWTSETIYSHTGWRSDLAKPGHWYLTAGGALGADGMDSGVAVDLGDTRLNRYSLPDPAAATEKELVDAVRTSLDLRHLAPAKNMIPMLGSAYRAPLPVQPESSVFVVGQSGSMKSSVSAVILQHYGRGFEEDSLPAEWKSTGPSLEVIAHQLAHSLFVIDDYAPQASQDPRKLAAAADMVFRGVANGSGRGRLRRDGTLRPVKSPRSQILSSGEDVPPGESLRGRLTISTLEVGSVNVDLLTKAQEAGRAGVLTLAMAGYVRHLAARMNEQPNFADTIKEQVKERRSDISAGGGHSRVPGAAAGLITGWKQWLEYAVSIKAVTVTEARAIMREVHAGIADIIKEQASHTGTMKVADVYVTSIAAALAGGSAHLADIETGREPADRPSRWGWEPYGNLDIQWHPRGTRIGWVNGEGDIFLDSGSAYEVARTHATKAGMPLNTTKVTVQKRLAEGKYLASVGKDQVAVVKRVEGATKRVIHVDARWITGEESEPDE